MALGCIQLLVGETFHVEYAVWSKKWSGTRFRQNGQLNYFIRYNLEILFCVVQKTNIFYKAIGCQKVPLKDFKILKKKKCLLPKLA